MGRIKTMLERLRQFVLPPLDDDEADAKLQTQRQSMADAEQATMEICERTMAAVEAQTTPITAEPVVPNGECD